MPKYEIRDVSPEDWHRANNPDKGGRPAGAKDTKPRTPTQKAKVVVKAAKWHVENNIEKLSTTVEKFNEEYSEGMNETDRYLRSRLVEEVSKLTS
ncbi:hypothetical protein [Pseudooceanicola nitratireducens]|uniref:hypothetical protein n=1 Tax=Pseudooceanicola nitratireducens TaxID=517719 RepID=UPI0023F4C2F9|nr:hypothetical protein [Pseudooceanicola nitratireducens]